MKEDIFVIIRYALAAPKKETGSFEEQNFTFNFIAEKGLDNAIKDINNYILSKYCEKEQKEQIVAEVLDKIRDEFISLYPKNYAGELELGGASCAFSLHKVLNIIDKYKASLTETKGSEG